MSIVNVTPDEGVSVGGGIELEWAPVDSDGNPITGAVSSITLAIEEPGQDPITKTGAELVETDGVYSYVHKPATAGRTYGYWRYNGPANADGLKQFWFWVDAVVASGD